MARMVRDRKMGVLGLLYAQVEVWRKVVMNHVKAAMESTGKMKICSVILTRWMANEKKYAEDFYVS